MLDNRINIDQPVYKMIQDHPEILDVLVELGFEPLANPTLLQSVGRVTSLRQGAKIINKPLASIIENLEWNGYQIITNQDLTE
ncbi:DUF1858 domain-containing protein [Facklamia languida]|uniref:DUF1858 domain-containing protein n=1 Tax=Facklamia languida CCUG 37842 TaxID=883113 RepID=H3NHF6_9LACT|nr:DUF1858 domain-containing protein [Facklamia languida]EHR38211.1 hypothetical protein HMPREF9708_00295 [Facklamia languida CCUG 37842]